MENKNDYEIKMDGKEHKFGEATRYTKDGKGRFDLIPGDIITDLIHKIDDPDKYNNIQQSPFLLVHAIECGYEGKYHDTIIHMMMYYYCEDIKIISVENILVTALPQMLQDLAIHFQKGAEKYGERNCEKGIPLWSFRDSGLRHLGQWMMGNREENHYIAAIWNFVMALWTIKHHPERCGDKPVETKMGTDAADKFFTDAIKSFNTGKVKDSSKTVKRENGTVNVSVKTVFKDSKDMTTGKKDDEHNCVLIGGILVDENLAEAFKKTISDEIHGQSYESSIQRILSMLRILNVLCECDFKKYEIKAIMDELKSLIVAFNQLNSYYGKDNNFKQERI